MAAASTTTGPAFGKIEYLKLHLDSPGRRRHRAISNFTVGLSERTQNRVLVTRDARKSVVKLYVSLGMMTESAALVSSKLIMHYT